jgi:Collagen triple helix repeat (20 copies)
MFSALRTRFTYANVAATLALVFAMSGGAYAANKFLITSTKQISPKVLKSLKGSSGAKGANGANGANGATGLAGPAGPGGSQGPQGPAGTNGTNGEPGKAGAKGTTGSPWTAGGTLPVGSTETGTITIPKPGEESVKEIALPISFPIPLAAELDGSHVEVVKVGATGTNCTGASANPTAPSGFLCVYLAAEPPETDISTEKYYINNSGTPATTSGASKAGAIFTVILKGEAEVELYGTWAVTG